jgi:hypothetical protein
VIGAITAGLFSAGVTPATNSYESISTVTVGSGGSSSITFSSIPSTYKHLQIRGIARSDQASTGQSALWVQFNSDTGSNYSWHRLYGNGSSAAAGAGTSTTWMLAGIGAYASNPANEFGASVIDVLDYQNTSKYKTVRGLTGEDENGAGYVGLHSGLWMNTAAVSTITIQPGSPYNWVQYSSFALYGIKG